MIFYLFFTRFSFLYDTMRTERGESMKKHKYLWACIYAVVLAAFTLYACLDTFVIARVYEVPEQPDTDIATPAQSTDADADPAQTETESDTVTDASTEAKTEQAQSPVTEPVVSEDSYEDENIKITVTEYRYKNSTVYVADVVLSSPEYLKTAFARSAYGRNLTEKTSTMAAREEAVLAINGDYYGARVKGYVIRGGVLYRETKNRGTEDLVIYGDGTMKIICEDDVSAEQLLADGAVEVFSFGPGLIEDGVVTVSSSYEVGQAMASNPRTAIGQIDDLHYVFVVSDGRTSASAGLSLYNLACFMSELGVKTAYNLDGGGSSTMVFNGRVINNPTTNGRTISERSVSDIVYIGY